MEKLTINEAVKFMKTMYGKPTYYDLYGIYYIWFILITIGEIFCLCYLTLLKNAAYIKSNWKSYKCNPLIMPVAGFINRPEGTNAIQSTEDNFVECLTETLGGIAGLSLNPIELLTSIINVLISSFSGVVGVLSAAISDVMNVFTSMLGDMAELFDRIGTVLLIAYIYLMDIIKRFMGILLATQFYIVFVYKFILACFDRLLLILSIIVGVTLTPLLTAAIAIMYLAITFLVANFWNPLAYLGLLGAVVTVIGIIIAIVLMILIMILTNIVISGVLGAKVEGFTTKDPKDGFAKIKKSLGLLFKPGPPIKKEPKKSISTLKGSFCFDSKTLLQMKNGSLSFIKNICVGDETVDGIVTAIIKTAATQKMYILNNIIVSEYHYVLYNAEWIFVKDHPKSIPISYHKKYLYCINTSSKRITIGDDIFLDWDDLDEKKIEKISKKIQEIYHTDDPSIHKYTDKGFRGDIKLKLNNGKYKKIKNIKIGDVLDQNILVVACVKIKSSDLYKPRSGKLYHFITDKGWFFKKTKFINDYNFLTDKYL
jgi:hypothetical protein